MSAELLLVILKVAVIACAIVSGVFLTFSDFVMKSLHEADPIAGIQSMQIINRRVMRSVFMFVLIGMSLVSVFLVVQSTFGGIRNGRFWILAGGLFYTSGTFLVTMLFNVPMNNSLESPDYRSVQAAEYWPQFVSKWTFWNWVRCLAALAASVCFLIAVTVLVES